MPYSPRVVGDARPDYHDLDSLVASPLFAGRSGEELALALYDHFTSPVHGTYHFWSPYEVKGNPRLRRCVHDAVKLVNAYGWMLCGQHSQMQHQVFTAAGMGARLYGLPGHALCAVEFDGHRHHMDIDMWTWFRTPEGHIASPEELAADAKRLILENAERSDPCDLPDRSLDDYAKMYAKVMTPDGPSINYCPDWRIRAHEMDFRLRPGETLVRSEVPRGRFHAADEWIDFRRKFPSEWVGHPRERYEPFRTYGNGRWVYSPDLSAACADFAEGVWESDGIAQDDGGLAGPGSATFRIQSPYPFCGVPEMGEGSIATSDGVFISAAGTGPVNLQITDAEGEWRTAAGLEGDFDERVDITDIMDSRYECLIRFTLGDGARLAGFTFDGFILTAPKSLPSLREGENRLEVRDLDRFGLATVPWAEIVDFRQGADVIARAESIENGSPRPYVDGWQQIVPSDDGPVTAVFRFDAPRGRRFAWFYALAQMREGPPDEAPRRARLEWSADGGAFEILAEREIPSTPNQWDASLEDRARPPAPARSVALRITSGTALTAIEFHGHLDCAGRDAGELAAVHRWTDGEGEKSFAAPAGVRDYTVVCGPNPHEHEIEMSVPSVPAPRGRAQ